MLEEAPLRADLTSASSEHAGACLYLAAASASALSEFGLEPLDLARGAAGSVRGGGRERPVAPSAAPARERSGSYPELGGVRGLLGVARNELPSLQILELDLDPTEVSLDVAAALSERHPAGERLLVRRGVPYRGAA